MFPRQAVIPCLQVIQTEVRIVVISAVTKRITCYRNYACATVIVACGMITPSVVAICCILCSVITLNDRLRFDKITAQASNESYRLTIGIKEFSTRAFYFSPKLSIKSLHSLFFNHQDTNPSDHPQTSILHSDMQNPSGFLLYGDFFVSSSSDFFASSYEENTSNIIQLS